MPIDFTCPNCNHRSIVADHFAGQSGPCAQCGQTISIPVPGQVLGQASVQPPTPPPPHSSPGAGQPTGNPYANPMGEQYPNPNGPYGAPVGMPPPPSSGQSDAGMRMLIPIDRSILAIIAGYFGLFSILCIPAPIALILGIFAIRDIKKNPAKHGLGRAWFAVIMGAIFSLITIISLVAAALGN